VTDQAFKPNKGQSEALAALETFFNDPTAFEFGLYGFAGTGKTTVIQEAFANYSGRYAMSAPTHKAVGVLKAMSEERGGSFRVETIHKMLSLQKSYNAGKVSFVPNPHRVPMVESYDLLVIDECSMIGEELDALIRPYIDGERVKIVWMGDALQLPPVGDAGDSRAFRAPQSYTLTEVVRNGGVIAAAVAGIRDDITAPDPVLARPAKDLLGEIELYGSRLWFRKFLEELDRTDGVDVQALAYTNKSVDWINANVRKAKFGADALPFVTGERLVAVETFEQSGSIAMYTGERCTVTNAALDVEMFPGFNIPCWELEVLFDDGKSDLVVVLDKDQKVEFNKRLNAAKLAAKKDRSLWGAYYDLKERFASLRPGYATTVHKSQGSTYDVVYLAQSDVMKSSGRDPELRNRLLYVGYSRTRSGLVLC
jgi:AAA domain/UvrD-like helicase C-terminal domain